MGINFEQHDFTDQQRAEFNQRVHQQLSEMTAELTRPCYNNPQVSIGAELELYLVNQHFTPAPLIEQMLEKARMEGLQEELNQYNIEFNLKPVNAGEAAFKALQAQLDKASQTLDQTAALYDGHALSIGILPTLDSSHLTDTYMTNRPRYQALTRELTQQRGAPFDIDIHGQDVVKTTSDDVTMEGANTSFQLHHKIPLTRFTDAFNTAQLVTPLVLAIAGNSPFFMGKRLWQETRIALFKQSIDYRHTNATEWRQPSRVTYGHGWLRNGITDCFTESVSLYPPLLPVLSERLNAPPAPFTELNLHHGTVWSWNRAVFEPGEQGHVRIEYRSLPAGPTNQDMLANAALQIGLVEALSPHCEEYLQRLPFQYAEYNFYRCAQSGLNAKILWPHPQQRSLKEHRVTDILADLLPLADEGLARIGISRAERDYYLGLIEHRLAARQTGATWQLNTYQALTEQHGEQAALVELCRRYYQLSHSGQPVAQWESP
ncbi:glutamate--cysteine ligase [Alteromonas gilva]|uniref:Glutamate--cysteine ligase n=1 Tax=Alteromonas gilva TaxID=2987522 RepID=A0ABT5L2R9_9ALTE|nr:glutamate--cysteine ligase [Alteromonas gilva]MDC8830724.1 glutamate--cysteine ligase [Alteromonas gilva]